MRLSALGLGAALSFAAAHSVSGQHIKVAVVLGDSAAGGVFRGAFTSAFRTLANVEVVTLSEEPDYVLSGVVMCEAKSCEPTTAYQAALRFYSPMQRWVVHSIAYYVPLTISRTPTAKRDSAEANLWTRLRFYEMTHQTWVVSWGSQRYEQAIRELVRKIDTECFERERMYSRYYAVLLDTAKSRPLYHEIESRSWMC
jgi:hypothetical protein